jgi:hypothetical protein
MVESVCSPMSGGDNSVGGSWYFPLDPTYNASPCVGFCSFCKYDDDDIGAYVESNIFHRIQIVSATIRIVGHCIMMMMIKKKSGILKTSKKIL